MAWAPTCEYGLRPNIWLCSHSWGVAPGYGENWPSARRFLAWCHTASDRPAAFFILAQPDGAADEVHERGHRGDCAKQRHAFVGSASCEHPERHGKARCQGDYRDQARRLPQEVATDTRIRRRVGRVCSLAGWHRADRGRLHPFRQLLAERRTCRPAGYMRPLPGSTQARTQRTGGSSPGSSPRGPPRPTRSRRPWPAN